MPVVDAGGSGSAITLSKGGVTIEGFKTINSGSNQAGIYVVSTSSNNQIINNNASNNYYGIHLFQSSNNILKDNIAKSNTKYGIYVFYSNGNTLTNNTASLNKETGIVIYYSSNFLIDNTANLNDLSGIELSGSNNNLINSIANSNKQSGIRISFNSHNNTLTNNTALNNTYGVWIDSESNVLTGNELALNQYGIYLNYYCNYNSLTDNTLSDNYYGIYIYGFPSYSYIPRYNVLVDNVITYSQCGIYLKDSKNNTIGGNLVKSSIQQGIFLYNSSGNIIYFNQLFYNANNAWDDGVNQWDNGTIGNYYSNYDEPAEGCVDTDNNSICDAAYSIPGGSNVDNYPMIIEIPPTTYTVCAAGCDFTSIQDAINAALPKDTILVYSGTYHENVDVNKELTLRGIDTAGMPVVDANGTGSAIKVSADRTTIEGFKTVNAGTNGAGIYIYKSSNHTIKGNNASDNYYGIWLETSSNSVIQDNIIINNSRGIIVSFSSNNNTFENNDVNGNYYGIYLQSSNNNTVENNDANLNSWLGIGIDSASGNTIKGNTVKSNKMYGIFLYGNNNTLTNNTAQYNKYGIYITTSDDNTLASNVIESNTLYGIYFTSSNNNLVYLNKLIYNANNVWDNGNNRWNISIGNYYSNYDEPAEDCSDSDSNGICDAAYSIPGGSNVDNYPMIIEIPPTTYTVCAAGCDFTSIQDAIDSAVPGDIIEVYSGTYYENVIVDKKLTLKGVNTAGMPVVDANNSGDAFWLSADGITVEGFKVINLGSNQAGIYVYSNNNTIINNNITGNTTNTNSHGIFIYHTSSNTVKDNILLYNWHGLYLYGTTSTACTHNILANNTVIENLNGIYIRYSDNNIIRNNTVSNNNDGFFGFYSDNNTITDNIVNSNTVNGIFLENSINNTLTGNIIEGNSYGIFCQPSENNSIYNNLFNNSNNFYFSGMAYFNEWNTTKTSQKNIVGGPYTGGNFWAKPDGTGFSETCNDTDGDGICDTPYTLAANNTDFLPLSLNFTTINVVIYSPLNTIYANNSILLEVSADKPVDTWLYNLNNAGDVPFSPNFTVITAQEGSNHLIIHANNTAGDVGKAEVDFTVDTTPPVLYNLTIDPTMPETNSTFAVSINIDDLNMGSVQANLTYPDASVLSKVMSSIGSRYQTLFVSSEYGLYNLGITAIDLAGNVNTTSVVFGVVVFASNSSIIQNGTTLTLVSNSQALISVTAGNTSDGEATINTTVSPLPDAYGLMAMNESIAGVEGIKYLNITSELHNITKIRIELHYTDEEIDGLDENSLAIFYWNGSSWINCSEFINSTIPDGPFVFEAGSNPAGNYAYAVVNHASDYGLGGHIANKPPTPPDTDGGITGGGGGGFYIPPTHTPTPIPSPTPTTTPFVTPTLKPTETTTPIETPSVVTTIETEETIATPEATPVVTQTPSVIWWQQPTRIITMFVVFAVLTTVLYLVRRRK